jgi:hypothetical protein
MENAGMRYSMTTPCPQCPFRNDIRGYLRGERVEEIVASVLNQQSFPCHKTTIDVEDGEGFCEREATDDSEQCAGAEIFAMKHGVCSQMRRICGRLGMTVAELDEDAPVCEDLDEMLAVHGGGE